ncbi:hypothetical protein [Agromyces albus]|uniref:Uncharacterized protein n=1 Tax=Agromyces albus TaxID=205332 RepID=A0A4Q2L3Y3_9MICO|nr:hypothetical protein [Agromyces albus]RXZ72279.1 hypothetical protein ESP51_05200 [Agromyces albus]
MGAILLGFVIAVLLRTLGLAEIGVLLTITVIDFGALLLGARIFRGRGEEVEPPRAWWRMTARPTLSRRLGILFVVLSLLGAVSLVLEVTGVYAPLPLTGDDMVASSRGIVELAIVAYLYLNSAVRLKRLGVPSKDPKPPQGPHFRPPVKLTP